MSPIRLMSALALGSLVALAPSALADHDRGQGKSRDRKEWRDERRDDRRERRADRREDRAERAGELIERAEEATDEFREDFDQELDESRLDGTDREDRYNEQVKQFEAALDRLRRTYDEDDFDGDDDDRDRDDWNDREDVRRELRRVVAEMRDVDAIMDAALWSGPLRDQWREVQRAVRGLNAIFGLDNPPRR